ncbi:CD302 antigen isoform X2 [Colossoma macropomum]|uniref:CD302 antigen isoform X2 n=1 Tax=Colossoma macropomum TaxID=42526 RepID=UPI001864CB97|nr:CD302 antigen isoform X2 [Colossoma macropomum]
MESGKWRFTSSLILAVLTFLCTHGQVNGDCPADGRTWVPFGQNCYHFLHGEEDVFKRYTMEKAKEICRDFALLTVLSAEENDFIADYSLKVWEGNIDVWLGMYYDSDDDEFKWNDESPLTFKNWEEGGAEDMPLIDTCVALHVASRKWENVSCSEQPENGVVCKTAQKAEKIKMRLRRLSQPLRSGQVRRDVHMQQSLIYWRGIQ